MSNKLAIAVTVTALAFGAWAPNALAAKKHAAPAPAPQAQTIPGVNPMTNAKPTPAVATPQPYSKVPGVNPL